mmetsp:Transcript_9766/g.13445  ORF Transcript_9766/g.13445 Transcript_9766/m.13445 type:complete len:274 (+) Transcript_9766:83-904(+)|eukprot:CAMPEP_0185264180 /NCGR_PEP_ID=MMETSP1359-20130426/20171_1 /TAXON_ID=552665 /ORGANISM="Bigelowiella longifila, Strain CCMP242" /LENGTH=273 /DNA_ID=CAMNT_0027852455 /DNA_START=26 /DNA_END=847 /DNA_ORIENTATION=+
MSGGNKDLGAQFGKYFYGLVDQKNYKAIGGMFVKTSMISFEGNNVQGPEKFIQCLQSWNKVYPKTQHGQIAVDTLPSPDGANLLLITGRRLDAKHQTQQSGILFTSSVLLRKSNDKYWIQNLIYRGQSNGCNVTTGAVKVGQQFLGQFYEVYDKNHHQLAGIYTDESLMRYNGDPLKGKSHIMCKLIKGQTDKLEEQGKKFDYKSVSWTKVTHKLETQDFHPSGSKQCQYILSQVTGWLIPDKDQPIKFGEVFLLMKGKGGWKVRAQGFRPIY